MPSGYASQINILADRLKKGTISQKTYTAEMGKIDNSMKADVDNLKSKCDKAEKNKETTAYICAGTSIAGIITILTGLHREHGIHVQTIPISTQPRKV